MPIIISFPQTHPDPRATHTSLVSGLSYFASRNAEANILVLDTQMQCNISDSMMAKLFYSCAAPQFFSSELFKEHALELTSSTPCLFSVIAGALAVAEETAESLKQKTHEWLINHEKIMSRLFGVDSIDTVRKKIDQNDPSVHAIVLKALVQIIKRPIRLIVGCNPPDLFTHATQDIVPVTIFYDIPSRNLYSRAHLSEPTGDIDNDIVRCDEKLREMLASLLSAGKKIFHEQNIITLTETDSTMHIPYSIQGLLDFLHSTVSKEKIEYVIKKFAEKMHFFNANAGRKNTGALFLLPGSQSLTAFSKLEKAEQILAGFRLLMEELNVHMTFIDLSRTPDELRELFFMASDYFVAPCVPHPASSSLLNQLLLTPRPHSPFKKDLEFQKSKPCFLGFILTQVENTKKAIDYHVDYPQPSIYEEVLADFKTMTASYNQDAQVAAFSLEVRQKARPHSVAYQKMLATLLECIIYSLPSKDQRHLPVSLYSDSDLARTESMTQAAQNLVALLTASSFNSSPPESVPVSSSPKPEAATSARAKRKRAAAPAAAAETLVDTILDVTYEAKVGEQTLRFSRELPSIKSRATLCAYLGIDDAAFLKTIEELSMTFPDPNNTMIWDLLMDSGFANFMSARFPTNTFIAEYKTAQTKCKKWLTDFTKVKSLPGDPRLPEQKYMKINKITELLCEMEQCLAESQNAALGAFVTELKNLLALRDQHFLQVKTWLAENSDKIVEYIKTLEMCPLNTLVECLKKTEGYSVRVWIEPRSNQKLTLHFQNIVPGSKQTLDLLFVVSHNSYAVIEEATLSLTNSSDKQKRAASLLGQGSLSEMARQLAQRNSTHWKKAKEERERRALREGRRLPGAEAFTP